MPFDFDAAREYLQTLQPGDEVIETGTGCYRGKKGVVYISDREGPTKGSKCVRWEDGMGTAVTWGTRRLTDTDKTFEKEEHEEQA